MFHLIFNYTMSKQKLVLGMALAALALTVGLSSCKKDEAKTTFAISSMTAGGVDINGATTVNTVPANAASIVIKYNLDVNTATVTADKFTLTRNYDGAIIAIAPTVVGSTVTVNINEALGNGALYTFAVKAGIAATDGQSLGAVTRSFTTVGTFVPAGMFAYWNFNGNSKDSVGGFNPGANSVIDITYVDSYKASAGKAAKFNGTTSLIRIPNGDQLDDATDFTISWWMWADSTKHGNFVFGLAGWYGFQFEIFGDFKGCKLAAQYKYEDGTSGSEDLWFPADGNLGWQGWTYCRDLQGQGGLPFLIASKWANVVCRYNATTKVGTMYINGEKMKEQDFNLWPDGDKKRTVTGLKYAGNAGNNTFVFGFIQDKDDPTIPDDWANYSITTNNHFKGMLDDVRIFHKALTEQEIQLMYASEKP